MWSIFLLALAGIALSRPSEGRELVRRMPPKVAVDSKSTASPKLTASPKSTGSPKQRSSANSPLGSPRTQVSMPSLRTQESFDSPRWSNLGFSRQDSLRSDSAGLGRPSTDASTPRNPVTGLTPPSLPESIAQLPGSRGQLDARPPSPARARGTTHGPGVVVTNNHPGNPLLAMIHPGRGSWHAQAPQAEASASSPWGNTVTATGRQGVSLHIINGPGTTACVGCEFPAAPGMRRTVQRALLREGSTTSMEYNNPDPRLGPLKVQVDQSADGSSTAISYKK